MSLPPVRPGTTAGVDHVYLHRRSQRKRAAIAAVSLAAPDCPAFFVADAHSRSMRELCALRRPAGVRHKVFLPQWFGTMCRRFDEWVQRRGGYVQNLHVLAELAGPIAIPADVAISHRIQLGLALTDQHAEGISAERVMRG